MQLLGNASRWSREIHTWVGSEQNSWMVDRRAANSPDWSGHQRVLKLIFISSQSELVQLVDDTEQRDHTFFYWCSAKSPTAFYRNHWSLRRFYMYNFLMRLASRFMHPDVVGLTALRMQDFISTIRAFESDQQLTNSCIFPHSYVLPFHCPLPFVICPSCIVKP